MRKALRPHRRRRLLGRHTHEAPFAAIGIDAINGNHDVAWRCATWRNLGPAGRTLGLIEHNLEWRTGFIRSGRLGIIRMLGLAETDAVLHLTILAERHDDADAEKLGITRVHGDARRIGQRAFDGRSADTGPTGRGGTPNAAEDGPRRNVLDDMQRTRIRHWPNVGDRNHEVAAVLATLVKTLVEGLLKLEVRPRQLRLVAILVVAMGVFRTGGARRIGAMAFIVEDDAVANGLCAVSGRHAHRELERLGLARKQGLDICRLAVNRLTHATRLRAIPRD